MPQIAPIALLDGAATPVSHTFNPRTSGTDQSVLVERGVVALADKKLTLSFSASSSKRATTRVEISFEYPVVDTTSATPALIGKGLFKGYFVIPDTFSQTNRKDLRAFVANAMDNAIVSAYVNDLDPIWG